MVIISGSTMYTTVEGLNEYTDYTFTISASTSKGSGPEAEIEERTAEDGTYICIHIPHKLMLACFQHFSLHMC